MKNTPKYIPIILYSLLLVFCFLVVFNRAMMSGYNKDEGQFIASGALLADQGLLPYRDYPYFHMPNLVFVYGILFRLVKFKLLIARLLSVFCSLASLAALLVTIHILLKRYSINQRFVAGVALVLILLVNPLFIDISGQAWNHDLPILLTLIAATLILKIVPPKYDNLSVFVSGVLLSLASGTRLVFIFLLPAFLYAVLTIRPGESSIKKKQQVSFFLVGFTLAMLPTIFLFLAAPQEFIFGNLIYPRLNTLYRDITVYQGPMDLAGKFSFLSEIFVTQTANLGLLILWLLIFLIPASLKTIRQRRIVHQDIFLLSLVLLLLLGAMLPTPSWYHYYYAPLPFLLLSIIYGLAQMVNNRPQLRNSILLALVGVAVMINLMHFKQYPDFRDFTRIGSWYPIQTRVLGNQIRIRAKGKPVLTFSPIYPLDGGADIYPQFATGSFSWRIGELLTASQRQALGLVSGEELETLLDQQPPGGILTGLTVDLETPFRQFIEKNNYESVILNNRLTFWFPK